MATPPTERELNRATLARQLLLERADLDVGAAVRHLVALQAQQAAAPAHALHARLAGLGPDAVAAAVASARLVRATLLRGTLHLVDVADHAVLHAAMVPTLRASRLHDRRFRDAGLVTKDVEAVVGDVMAHLDEPRTNADMEAFLAPRFGEAAVRAWWALRTFLPVCRVDGFAPDASIRPAYVAGPPAPPVDHDRAVDELVLRHLAAHGPATLRDVGAFTLLRRPVLDAAVQRLGDRVVTIGGTARMPLLDVPDAPRPPADTPAPPRLLGMWDNALLASHDRARLLPPRHRAVVVRRNGDVLPTLLVDGWVAGVWRVVDDGVEASALDPLDEATWDGLAAEAAALGPLLAPDRRVFARHEHWWDKGIPAVDVRLLTA